MKKCSFTQSRIVAEWYAVPCLLHAARVGTGANFHQCLQTRLGLAWLPCWPPYSQQVSHQRGIWGSHKWESTQKGSPWLWNPGQTSPEVQNKGQWPHKKDLCPVTNISFMLLVLLDTLQLAAGATGLFSQGATAVVHGCSIHALGPILGETTLLAHWAPMEPEYPPEYSCRERYKQAAFSLIFIEKQQPAGGVVSQPHNDKQHTSLDTGYLTHWTWFTH